MHHVPEEAAVPGDLVQSLHNAGSLASPVGGALAIAELVIHPGQQLHAVGIAGVVAMKDVPLGIGVKPVTWRTLALWRDRRWTILKVPGIDREWSLDKLILWIPALWAGLNIGEGTLHCLDVPAHPL